MKGVNNINNFNKIEENKKLIEEFPFLLPRNRWTGKVAEDYDYSYTELDSMPTGWRKAFGLDLCKELKESLIKENYLDKYRITDIKEKYGGLRWYDCGAPEDFSRKILPKYVKKSLYTCISCGQPATKISVGWISPWCDECAKKTENYEHFIDIKEYYDEIKDKDEE